VIEEIRRLMLKSSKESFNIRENLTRGELGAVGQQQQQQQQIKGAHGKLQIQIWDP
jgi:hypothetical protein